MAKRNLFSKAKGLEKPTKLMREQKAILKNADKAFRADLAKNAPPGVDTRYCTGHSFVRDSMDEKIKDEKGNFLTKPCEHFAMRGSTVCLTHGGRAPQVQQAAEQTLLEYRNRAAQRLTELAEQNDHLPTALGAAVTVLKQQKVIKEPNAEAAEGANRPIIKIGILFGGMPASGAPKIKGALTNGAQDAEIIES